MLHLTDYEYILHEELIAQTAAHPPESAKLLIYDRTSQQIIDGVFSDLPGQLTPDTLIIFNNSKVVKARLPLPDLDGEILFLRLLTPHTFEALVRPGKKFKPGMVIQYTKDISFAVDAVTTDGRQLTCTKPILEVLETYGQMPLPPYISYDETKESDYQPIVADSTKPGSVAAPTAALHFSDTLLDQITAQGHQIDYVTLHVGLGTFKSVDVDDITRYQIHDERAEVSLDLFAKIATQKIHNKPILAIGTTSTRTLESLPYIWVLLDEKQKRSLDPKVSKRRDACTKEITLAQAQTYIHDLVSTNNIVQFSTTIFLYPGTTFHIIDQLITNFHLPKSSLLMLVAAFVGYENMRKIYKHALTNKYRFFSFGDGMRVH